MKHLKALALTALTTLAPAASVQAEEVYRDAHVRFTLIDDGTIRLEYAPDGKFVDNKSFVAVVRQYPVVKHTIKENGKQVTISTDKMKLVYKKTDGPLTADNLSITYNVRTRGYEHLSPKAAPSVGGRWTPGLEQQGNLKGTARTLDGFSGETNVYDGHTLTLEDGILATDGWTLIDDSQGLLFTDEADGWDWVTKRPSGTEGAQDWYFMAYGHNYKDALKSYTNFAGKMPLPPRYTFGYWWSRYWSYSDQDFRNLIDNFHRLNIPLDVLVIDMDWHPISPEAGGGWTGWDWNDHIFPDYKQFLSYLDAQGVKTTMNLHPAEGVRPYEKKYDEFIRRYGRDAQGKAVEWLGSDKQMVRALFDTYLHPYVEEGVDFWWLDWQQWLNDKALPELSNTWWCNYLFFSDMELHSDKRPMLYHRWGGLGNHRYQIGFSGDAFMTWESLEYLPYFNSTASNVLYGYWSHDIGGHQNRHTGLGVNPEMYTRAMQMGQYLPVLRSHSTKDESLNKEPWAFDHSTQQRIVDAITGRYALVPYIYTMARQAHDTGLSLCRPLYYDYPEAPEAYESKTEYLFGDNMLIAPAVAPADSVDGLTHMDVYLPQGSWYDCTTGCIRTTETGTSLKQTYSLDEYPVFVKAGSILPFYYGAQNLGPNDQALTVRIYPGGQSGSFCLYEDNGEDNRYADEYATTQLSYEYNSPTLLTVSLGARQGRYAGMPAHRHCLVAIPETMSVQKATLGGRELPVSYDYENFETVIDLGDVDCTAGASVKITLANGENAEAISALMADAVKQKSRRLMAAIADYKQHAPGMVYTPDFGFLESLPLHLHYHPEAARATLEKFDALYARLPEVAHEQIDNADLEARFLKRVGWK